MIRALIANFYLCFSDDLPEFLIHLIFDLRGLFDELWTLEDLSKTLKKF
jgi:hypothetical protein